MSTLNKSGGQSPGARTDKPILQIEGEDALMAFESEKLETTSPAFLTSHQDTEDLRYVAERYRRLQKGKSESKVHFEMDAGMGRILVNIQDEVSGDVQLKLTPEQVEDILQNFESTSDNEATLTSFFIDFKV